MNALFDTSVLIARAAGEKLGSVPAQASISVMSLAELHYGVHKAADDATRAQRLRTLAYVEREMEAIGFDDEVARTFGEMAAAVRRQGRRPKIADLIIAATAKRHAMTLVTRDAELASVPGVESLLV